LSASDYSYMIRRRSGLGAMLNLSVHTASPAVGISL
jgi:hypothetical protein